MGNKWCYLLFMLWFTYLIVSSVLLFAKGFLLSRVTQENKSTCMPLTEVSCISTTGFQYTDETDPLLCILNNDFDNTSNVCLPQKARIVLLIVDALRYDFTSFDDKITNPLPFQNKLPIISELQKRHPESSRLFKFIADPPTTTMQRLKALTTGSLPTFIDAGSNFATPEIDEDNIINQVVQQNLSVVFMGDDTWNGLYPYQFLRKYPYPSFNVWDLDTVDDGIRTHLYEELNNTDWSLLIGHFLGVDHCGHRYGPNHPEMARKLNEINTVIENVAEQIDPDTMLFVIGDHGMTVTGDHGGESWDEVTSALFIYSKRPLYSLDLDPSDTVKQVSIVPTMATILGVPIPFSNLGTLILNGIPIVNNSHVKEWQLLLHSLWSNVQQMISYINEYSKSAGDTFSDDVLKSLNDQFTVLKTKIRSVSTEIHFAEFAEECVNFMGVLRKNCEDIWIKFDSFSMTRGLLLLFLSIFFVYTVIDGIPHNRLPEIFASSFLLCSYSAILLGVALAIVLHYFSFIVDLLPTIFFFTGLISQFMLVILIIQNWELISLNWYDRSQKERLLNVITRLILIFNLFSLFSNSFIIEESFILLFLLNTIILIATISVSQNGTKKKCDYKSKIKLLSVAFSIAALVRISMYFWRCREEQQWCFESLNVLSLITEKTETTKFRWLLTVICLALFITSIKVWLRNCGNLNGYSLTVTLAKYAPTVVVVCISGYWVLDRLPLDTKNKLIRPWQSNILAWIAYVLVGFGISVTMLKPLCVYILPNHQEVTVGSEENAIPQLFKHVKTLFDEPKKEEVPVICGLGTVYSAVYIIIGVYLTLLIALLHGSAVAPSTIIMFLTSAFVLIITSIIRLEKAKYLDQLFDVPNMSVLIWVILSQYFFYGTGHQPSFPNISWNAAFIGTSGMFTNNFISAALIIINTFCSQILISFLIPLILIVPFTVSVMMPSAVRNSILNQENTRGEVMLFERDDLMLTATFTMSCKYLMCHGIRVFASMLAATIHCRHLMVWNIFAPKLIFEALGLFVALFVVNISYLLLVLINNKVDKLIKNLNKKFS